MMQSLDLPQNGVYQPVMTSQNGQYMLCQHSHSLQPSNEELHGAFGR